MKSEKSDVVYFVPGEACLVVHHQNNPVDVASDPTIQTVFKQYFPDAKLPASKQLNTAASTNTAAGMNTATLASDRRQLSFTRVKTDQKNADLLSNTSQAHQALQTKPTGQADQEAAQPVQGEQRFSGMMPNWFLAGADQAPLGGGGPGRVGIEENEAESSPGAYRLKCQFKLSNLNAVNASTDNKQAVDVFILDSIPTDYKPLPTDSSSGSANESLRAAVERKLTLSPAAPGDLPDAQYLPADPAGITYVLPDPNHPSGIRSEDVSDHGLFIAGIVHSIAPEANLYLVEVLNKYGVGSYFSLARGLERVQQVVGQAGYNNPFVINLSVSFPLPDQATLAALLDEVTGSITLEQLWKVLSDTFQLLTDLHNEIGAGGTLVAAAGNDNVLGQGAHRPDARYPAAAASIIGVGALKKQSGLMAADYSNQADLEPSAQRVWTLGGDYNDTDATDSNPEKEQGILGISTKSTTGYKWWAGTSFATAVVSGAMAMLLSQGADRNSLLSYMPQVNDPAEPSEQSYVLEAVQG